MVFPTLQFILFFVAVLALNAWVFDRAVWRKAVLIAASYTFYAAWDVRFLALMAGVTAVAYLGGLGAARPGTRRMAVALSVAALVGVLGLFKYYNFFTLSLTQLLAGTALARDLTLLQIVLPVGISFYTFQAISYVVDVARGDVEARKNPFDIALYVSFFPQLVAGPIVRAAHFLPQIDAPTPPDRTIRGVAVGLILIGLFKKMVVANYLAVLIVDPVFGVPEGQSMVTAGLGALAYAVQIYCDFSGYSDIAIGIAALLGYRFLPNFDQPYRATSLRNFWQRWHISLSSWIRDYLYIPLGGNRGGAVVLLATFLLAGLWHGAGWTFVAWGLGHGLGLVVERRARARGRGLPIRIAGAVTFLYVTLLWIPFRADSFGATLAYLQAFTRIEGYATPAIPAIVLILIATGLLMNWLPRRWASAGTAALGRLAAIPQALILALGTLLLFAAAQEGTAPFIYFQF